MDLKSIDFEKAKAIVEFLEKNFTYQFTYTDLARRFGINKFKLKQIFKVVAKVNIHEFVVNLRVESAKHLLATTDRKVSDIATRVGFDKSNLNIQFKRKTGKTPTEYRNNKIRNDYTSKDNHLPGHDEIKK